MLDRNVVPGLDFFLVYLKKNFIVFIFTFMCVKDICCHGKLNKVRGQPRGIGSFHPCGSQGLNSGS